MSGDREAWLDWRRGGIGGSDIGALLGLSSYTSPWSLWADKRGLLPPEESTQRQRIGQRMEALLAAEFHDETGLHVVGEQTWCTHRSVPYFRCTVDGFVAESSDASLGDVLGTLQFKSDARYAWPNHEPPPAIRAQCIWEMGVTGLEHCWLVVMFGGFRITTFELDWDDDARADWDLMAARAETFWTSFVVGDDMPPIDGSDATTDALKAVYPDHDPGMSVDLDEIVGTLTEREQLKAIVKQGNDRLKEIDNEIRATFGDAEIGLVGGEPAFTYRTSERAGYTVAPTTVRTLRKAATSKRSRRNTAA